MFRNYIVTALRNIIRHKLYSFINIGGLAVGLACVILISAVYPGRISYDKWIPDTENLYRVEKTSYIPGREPFAVARVPFLMPAAMRDEIPEVTAMTRLNYNFMTLFAGDRQFRENVAEVDPNFFGIIKLPLAKGDPDRVFKIPESLVLSESAAQKYFGTTDAIGKIIRTTDELRVGRRHNGMSRPFGPPESHGDHAGHSPQFPFRWRPVHAEHLHCGPYRSERKAVLD